MKIAVMNTDQRMQAVYFNLSKTYDTYLMNEFTNLDKLSIPDVFVLPLQGPSDQGVIDIKGQKVALPLSFWASLKDHTKVICGLPNSFVEKVAHDVYYYMQDDVVKQKNAVLTAEGVLCLLIDHTPMSIKECHIDVIGYGTCGREIVSWLRALQVPTRIIRRITQDEVNSISVDEYRHVACGDVVINTAPDYIITKEMMNHWQKKPLLIDIASGEYIQESDALLCGIHLIKAKSLPSIYTWLSAGEIIAEAIREELCNER